ncbi:MAG: low molecular weight protein-tyrosine-phosphatase [Bdellovibrio sp.]
MLRDQKLDSIFEVDSAGTSGLHIGELPDARSRKHAKLRGYELDSLSRKITHDDLNNFDYIFVMDDSNLSHVLKMDAQGQHRQKIKKLTDLIPESGFDHIPDPYYMGGEGFEKVLDLIEAAAIRFIELYQNER